MATRSDRLHSSPFTDLVNIQDERSRLLASTDGRRPHPQARSKCTKLIFFLLLFLILLTIAISVALGVTLSAGSEASAEQSGGCSAATYRFDCYPEGDGNEAACASRGCCWNSSVSPSCFYPDGYGYSMDGALSFESYGHSSATLSRKANQPVQYTGPVVKLRVDVYLETQYRLRVKVLHCMFVIHESIHVHACSICAYVRKLYIVPSIL